MNKKQFIAQMEKTYNTVHELAEITGNLAELEVAKLSAAYSTGMSRLIELLEVDKNGFILVNANNAKIAQQIASLGQGYVQAMTGSVEILKPFVASSVEEVAIMTAKVAQAMGAKVELAQITKAANASVVRAQAAIRTSFNGMAVDVSSGINQAVNKAITEFVGNKDTLAENLLGAKPDLFNELRKRNEAILADASRAEKAVLAFDKVEASGVDELRKKIRKELAELAAKRKAEYEAVKAKGLTPEQIKNQPNYKARDVAQREIFDASQDAGIRANQDIYGQEAKYVNVKTTNYDSNCWQAQDQEAMTLAEWSNSEWGLPRSGNRTAQGYCKCILVPSPQPISGAQLSDVTQ